LVPLVIFIKIYVQLKEPIAVRFLRKEANRSSSQE